MMEIHLTPDVEKRLHAVAMQSGRATDDLLEDALALYLSELSDTQVMLDTRYDEVESGAVSLIDGEEAFHLLQERTESQRKLRT